MSTAATVPWLELRSRWHPPDRRAKPSATASPSPAPGKRLEVTNGSRAVRCVHAPSRYLQPKCPVPAHIRA